MLRLLPLSVLLFPCLLFCSIAVGQTVIIQEVSNGPAGSMEYVELLVVPDTPADPCTPATCLDLRGWMIDDNNGYHGSNGVAQGAARFSDHLLWSCVPVGTLITIYNAEDPNPALPPDDVDLSDGDCSIVIPSSDPSLLTYTNSTPAPVPCDDPGGWGTDPTPNWQSNLAMANSGDCMRVCDPAGCLVFAFCFGSAATNATVHFPSNGGDLVWYFNDGDPTDVANWVQGCAGDLAACGADDQSPGGSNSPANASWMALFNNGCVPPTPIAPLVVTATTTTACGCDAVATAAASGSTGPYTFTWSDATWNTLVQNSNTATGLCAGSYHVIATSTTGCSDTATVVVTGGGMLDPGSDAVVDLCSDDGPVDLFTLLGGTPDPSGQWSPALPGGSLFDTAVDPPGDYTYSFQSAPGCPPAQSIVTVNVTPIPEVTVAVLNALCAASEDGSIALAFEPQGPYTVTWSGGLPEGATQTGLPAGNWDVRVSGSATCFVDLTVSVSAPTALVSTTTTTSSQCGNMDGSACVELSGGTAPYSISWDDTNEQATTCATDLPAGSYTATITDANGCALVSTAVVGNMNSTIVVNGTTTDVNCAGQATGAISLTMDPPGEYEVSWQGPGGYTAIGATITGLFAGTYTYTVSDLLGCAVSGDRTVDDPMPLGLDLNTVATSCSGLCDGQITMTPSGGTQPWTILLDQAPVQAPINALCAGPHVLTVQDAQGCTLAIPFAIVDGPAGVQPTITGPAELCVESPVATLVATPDGGIWNGVGVDDAGTFDPGTAGVGMHVIRYTLPCASPGEWTVNVVPMPQADFTLPTDGALVENTSTDATTYQWYVDGTPAGPGPDLTLPAASGSPDQDDLSVCLVARDQLGCADSTCAVFSFPQRVAIHVPNAFSPNGDLINDQFIVQWAGPPPTELSFHIFDRWGRPVFVADQQSMVWDGTTGGDPLPIGVYPWRLTATVRQEPITMTGHVTLLR